MKNIPRIFIDENLSVGKLVLASADIVHYLSRVMRTDKCLVFNAGLEFSAQLSADLKYLKILSQTDHSDPSNDIVFYFAPVKRIEEMLNMVTQMGVKCIQPVITDRTVTHHINWKRVKKIIIEASEQSNRNSIPELMDPVKFADIDKNGLVFADERMSYVKSEIDCVLNIKPRRLLIGPEGGFSDAEFAVLDKSRAVGICLGHTILRAETAAVAALAKII